MTGHRERTCALFLLLILIAIGGVVMYGKDKVPYKAHAPRYAAPR